MKPEKLKRIRKAIFERYYFFSFIIIFFVYIGINIWINQIYVTLPVLTGLAKWFLIPFVLFNFLIIPFLVALTINLAVLRFKEAGSGFVPESGTGVAGLGVFGGILGGACAGCFVGLFPAFLGLFGITASLSILPFYGLELQVASAGLLILAVYLLTKDIVCEVPLASGKKKK